MMEDNVVDVQTGLRELLDDQMFWAPSRCSNPEVRSACYQFITFCCVKFPEIIEPRINIVANEFLSNAFKECSTSCHQYLFVAILSLIKYFPSSWEAVSVKQSLLKEMIMFIQCGTSLHLFLPCLLPLIGSLPANVKYIL